MEIRQAIIETMSLTGCVIGRPDGLILEVTREGGLWQVAPGERRRWYPNARTLLAQDYAIGPRAVLEQLQSGQVVNIEPEEEPR